MLYNLARAVTFVSELQWVGWYMLNTGMWGRNAGWYLHVGSRAYPWLKLGWWGRVKHYNFCRWRIFIIYALDDTVFILGSKNSNDLILGFFFAKSFSVFDLWGVRTTKTVERHFLNVWKGLEVIWGQMMILIINHYAHEFFTLWVQQAPFGYALVWDRNITPTTIFWDLYFSKWKFKILTNNIHL